MKNVYISVVVPVYNTPPEYFNICMRSVLQQTFHNFEVILVDDGSENETKNLCKYYGKMDKRVQVIRQENKGVSEARNIGVKNAKGDWIIFLDPDDWWELNTLESLVDYLNSERIDILFFSYFDMFEEIGCEYERSFYRQKPILYQEFTEVQKRKLQIGILDESIREMNFTGSCWMHIANREFLMKHKLLFDIQLKALEDIVYDLQILEYARVAVLDKSFYHYRHHSQSICNKFNIEIIDILEIANNEIGKIVQAKLPEYWESFLFFLMYNYVKTLRLYFLNKDNDLSFRDKYTEWKKYLKNSASCVLLSKSSVGMILKKRKIFGILFFFSFRLRSFRMVDRVFHTYFMQDKSTKHLDLRG